MEAYLKTKTLQFEHNGIGVSKFRIYYKIDDGTGITRDPATGAVNAPYIEINAGSAAQTYTIAIPAQLPLVTEGTWLLAVTALDAEGNESASADVSRFFDLSAPAAPTGLRVS